MYFLFKTSPTYNKKKRFVLKKTTFITTNQKIGEFDTKQALCVLQIGAGPGVPAGILHGARGSGARRWRRRAGTVGGLREAGLLQIHGSQQRGEQGLLH